jgi:hypothetical protein
VTGKESRHYETDHAQDCAGDEASYQQERDVAQSDWLCGPQRVRIE